MHFPIEISLFGDTIYLHLIFETLAFIIGVRVYYFLRNKKTDIISSNNRLWIMLGAMIGALIGSRVIAFLEMPSAFHQQTLLTFYQNKTIVGGLLGGLFGVEIIKLIIGEKQSSGDMYVIPLIVAIFIGRIGCFSMGIAEQTYGIPTTLFTGMDLGDGVKRHPVALYEMGFMLILLLMFTTLKFKDFKNGEQFKLFMILYFAYRFSVEFLKPYESIFLGLSIIQWCAIFIFIYYASFIKKSVKSYA